MSTLLVDNYDSYTYNVFHLLAAVCGEEPIVIHNDMVSWRALSRWDFDAIVLSPGPGHPARWHDFGVCSDILRASEIPVLGICLGHQGLGHALSGLVDTAPCAMHGRLSRVHHLGRGLFEGVPQDFSVVRYHSLAVTGPLEPDGRVTAWTEDGVVMGIEHAHRPMWGVQFHPESIATEHGQTLIRNFYELARARGTPRPSPMRRRAVPPPRAASSARPRAHGDQQVPLQLSTRTIAGEVPAEPLFERLFGAAEYAFWLDSADAPTRLAQRSFLGTSAGPDRLVLEYDVNAGSVTTHSAATEAGGRAASTVENASIFTVLGHELAARELVRGQDAEPVHGEDPAPQLLGGFVGYLGYECKADCGSPNVHRSDVPDAVLMLANRVVAIDHVQRRTQLFALGPPGAPETERWLAEAARVARELLEAPPVPAPSALASDDEEPVAFRCGRGREQYLADIARCQVALTAGESYEVCLTDQLSTTASPDPWQCYRTLRATNPAPFGAYLKLGEVTVLSSSPERFLSVDRERRVQARPIKGTAPRANDPAEDRASHDQLLNDEKTFAEHLMIVDLLRNDLGRVCALDTVHVPELMVVESYPTVHQLISTITGTLEEHRTAVECVRACFPGGSMTGAPKLRTMSIIDDIERVARGVYSGAIGYFGLDGVADLSIVIRTIVMRAGGTGMTTIGAGGAIVMQSDPEEEFAELLLKARAPMTAVARTVTGRGDASALNVELEPPSAGMAEAA